MIKNFVVKFLKSKGYSKTIKPYLNYHSTLNSTEYILEKKQSRTKVVELIQKLTPYKTDKELIRIGPEKDGGYLVPNDLEGIKACFSPGVSDESGFEKNCHKLGMEIYMADASVEKANLNVQHDFIKKFIGSFNNDTFITMDKWVEEKADKNGELLLQMDIEGAEYSSFLNMSDSLLERFRIMIIEFHDLQKLWAEFPANIMSEVFTKILQTHTCVHIHPNNCCGFDIQEGVEIPRVAEFTFIRNERISTKENIEKYPHPLDIDNTSYPTLELPEIWYKPKQTK